MMVELVKTRTHFDEIVERVSFANKRDYHWSSDTVHVYAFTAGGNTWYLLPENEGVWQGVIVAATEAMKEMQMQVQITFDRILQASEVTDSMLNHLFTAKNMRQGDWPIGSVLDDSASEVVAIASDVEVADERQIEQLNLFDFLGDV